MADSLEFDVLIAGGGPAGVLAAARLLAANPQLKLAILEKEGSLGGRLRVTSPQAGATATPAEKAQTTFSYGLNAASDQLFDFWNQTFKSLSPDAPELEALVRDRQASFGVLAGGRIASNDIGLWFSAKGARTLGGLAASRQWTDVDDVVKQMQAELATDDDEDDLEAEAIENDDDASAASETRRAGATKKDAPKEHPFSHYWKKQRKAPAAIVLEHYAAAYGVPDLWTSSTQALVERATFHSSRLHSGAWDLAFEALAETPAFQENVKIATNSRIVDANFENDTWVVETVGGTYTGKKLIVAQPPWQAMTWLRRALWPAQVLQVASKTKPVSAVVLAERFKKLPDVTIPDVIIVPSERVQIIRNNDNEICFQATIDFELSLQAPAVIKSVRALKRARRKLLGLYPGICTEGDHLALHPVAWAQSPMQRDRRWLTRMTKKDFNSPTLAFCGDAYGASYDGDANLVKSLVSACAAVTSR